MGLDFYGFYVKKGETPRDVLRFSYGDFMDRELFYGRKSWELVDALQCDTQDTCLSELTLENWVNLMEILSPISPYFDEIHSVYHNLYYVDEDFDDLKERFPKEYRLIKMYEEWYDKNFDEEPVLGYDSSVVYMKTFWEAADKVLDYLENPDYSVWMRASY